MNRRKFLKNSLFATGGLLLPSSGIACGAISSQTAWTVARWFGVFMVELALEEAYRSIRDFKRDQNQGSLERIDATNRRMAQDGFVNGDNRGVYQIGQYSTYELGHSDQFNGCVVVFDGDMSPKAMVEGPSVMALSAAARDFRKQGVSSAEAQAHLFPTGQLLSPSQNAFSHSYDRNVVLQTTAGTLEIDYVNTGFASGQVGIKVQSGAGQLNFAGVYDITF